MTSLLFSLAPLASGARLNAQRALRSVAPFAVRRVGSRLKLYRVYCLVLLHTAICHNLRYTLSAHGRYGRSYNSGKQGYA